MNTISYHQSGAYRLSRSLRRLGFAGLMFFTIKGLFWLAIPLVVSQWL